MFVFRKIWHALFYHYETSFRTLLNLWVHAVFKKVCFRFHIKRFPSQEEEMKCHHYISDKLLAKYHLNMLTIVMLT